VPNHAGNGRNCGYRVCRAGCLSRALRLASRLRICRLRIPHTRAARPVGLRSSYPAASLRSTAAACPRSSCPHGVQNLRPPSSHRTRPCRRFALGTTRPRGPSGLLAAVAVQEATRMGDTGPLQRSSERLRADHRRPRRSANARTVRPSDGRAVLLKSTRTPAAMLRAREARHMADHRLTATPKER
jgi:hypothetical protein